MVTYDAPTQSPHGVSGGALQITPNRGGEIAGRQLQAFGNALEGVGELMMRRQTQLNLEENEYREKLATQALDTYLSQVELEAQAAEGVNAWGLTEKAVKDIANRRPDFEKILTNERQRKDFAPVYESKIQDTIGRLSRYEQTARTETKYQADLSGITIATSRAATNATDSATVTQARQEVSAYVQSIADRKGWSGEQRQAETLRAFTTFHTQVVESLLDIDPRRAAAYFQKAVESGEIDGQKADEVRHNIEQTSSADISYRLADRLSAQGATMGEAREALDRAVISGDITASMAKEAMSEYKSRAAESEAALNLYRSRANDAAQNLINNGAKVRDIPPSLRTRMDPQYLAALMKDERVGADAVETDWSKYYDLRLQATSPDPAERAAFRNRDLRAEFGSLSKEQRKSLIDLQTKVDDPTELGEVRTVDGQIAAAIDRLPYEKAHKAEFSDTVRGMIAAEQKVRGKKLDADGRQKIIDMALIEGEVDGSGMIWNDRKRMWRLSEGERGRFVPTSPPESYPDAEWDRSRMAWIVERNGKRYVVRP